MKLHIGCGPRILEGWVNLDIADVDGATQCDIREGIPAKAKSVDAIYAEDFFEHLDQRDQILFLAEAYRVLKPDAVCRLTMPELTYSLLESDYERGRVGVCAIWHSGHLLVPTRDYMRTIAEVVGFSVLFNGRDRSVSPLMPPDLRPHTPRPDTGNMFVDLVKET